MTDENENRPGRAPLTLKPRTGSSVSTGTVKQSFSHGRSKTVVVETKRPRIGAPPPVNLAAPSPSEKRPPAFDVRGPQSRPGQPAERAAAEERTAAAARARAAEAAPPPAAAPPVEAAQPEVRAEAPAPVA